MVKIPFGLPIMKRDDQISTQIMTRSKTHLHCFEEEEGAPGENTEAELGNTNEEIDRFTLGPEDMEASPTQTQPHE
nr:hypothetical protein CFP56_49194 [Quercus suber]